MGPSFLERFIAVAERMPEHAAVVQAGVTTSYGELLSLARRIAFAVRLRPPHDRVLIHVPQGAAAYAAMFGCAMAGAVYAPVNVAAPIDRQQRTATKFEPDIVVTLAALRDDARALAHGARLVGVDDLEPSELDRPVAPPTLVYVMFTSGSTGQPKGVMVPFDALSHYVDWAIPAMDVGPEDRWSQHPNIAFDLSVLDIFGALCAGATLYPITETGDLLMPAKAIRRHRLTIWDSVPSVMTSMVKIRSVTPANLETLRLLTFCGEPLLRLHLDAIFEARPEAIVHNTYGPTEATVSCTLVRLGASDYTGHCGASVAIGDAIPDMAVHLVGGDTLDEGEIVITGPQVAAGYWRDPDPTAASFRPFGAAGTPVPAYYTGDWARRIDGRTFFVGRRDNQVKVRGERIELDDIAAAVIRCGWGMASVVFVDDTLVAFVERDEPAPAKGDFIEAMKRHLPPHLVPARVHAVPSLPRNANDKIDRTQLARRARDLA